MRVEANDRRRLKQLCSYITRPALSDERVQLNSAGQVELKLNTPWRDGTTHLVMSPLEFMQRLAAPVPWPSLRRAIQPGSGRSRTTLDGRLLSKTAVPKSGRGRDGVRVNDCSRRARRSGRIRPPPDIDAGLTVRLFANSESVAIKMIGNCALCQKDANLQDSHLIPKWAYRRVRVVCPVSLKAPVHIADGNAVLSNKQTTKYLLCADCEQRFSRREDYVARLMELDNNQIKLFSRVTRLATPKKVLASLDEDVDGDQIAYFAASIMWRGCVMTGDCKLGPYEPKFRQYLLGTTRCPPEAAISVGLLEQSPKIDVRGWVSEPTSTKTSMGWLHGFLLAGCAFRCWVGKAIPQEWQMVSLAGPNPKKYVSIIKPEDCADLLAAVEMAGSARHRGRLATLQLAQPK